LKLINQVQNELQDMAISMVSLNFIMNHY